MMSKFILFSLVVALLAGCMGLSTIIKQQEKIEQTRTEEEKIEQVEEYVKLQARRNNAAISIGLERGLNAYIKIKNTIKLGDSAKIVIPKLDKVMKKIPADVHRDSEQYMKDGVKVLIYYVRSGWTPDGLSTDDEYTPYIFNDNILIAIGWATLGGPKSRAKGSS